ncbi:MAG: glycosyltransferase [Deltaproteobacteria bacterium]|nr:glycosyltransferase [Deltaproteobacteria bacterium]
MNPPVSVIMAAYNAEKTIGAAIRSILGQTHQNLELIIVDDASRDRTVEVIHSFSDPRLVLLRNRANIKQGLSRNIAIDAAKGEFIAVIDADDLSLPTRLQKQVEFLVSHPEVDVVGSNSYLFNDSGAILGGLVNKGQTHQELTARIDRKIPLTHPTIMGRAEWFRKYRYRQYPRSQDRDLFLRSYRHSTFANTPLFLYAYRDPGKLSMRKLVLASWTNLVIRLRHRREYGLPVYSVLASPLLMGGKWFYWGLLALRGQSLFALPCQKLENNQRVEADQAWIWHCLGISSQI